jgi:hypothetical protein
MWILNFISFDWVYDLLAYITHLLVIGGAVAYVLGLFARRIIFIENYGMLLKTVGALVFVLGMFGEGYFFNESVWQNKVAEAQAKIKLAEQQSEEANNALEAERQKKQQVVVEYRDRVKTEIQVQKEYIDKECTLTDSAIDLYKKSLSGPVESKK